jgi:uncharacterized membrane protein
MMKSTTVLIGIILTFLGIIALAYQGFTYTKNEKVAEIGAVQVSADKQHTVYFPPLLGGLSLAAGIVLMIIGRKKL